MYIKILRILICLSFFFVPQVYADQYPSKVITIVVPFAAGGPADVLARLLARPMGTSLKTQVIIENVTGAGSTIGANRVAKAPAIQFSYTISAIPPRSPSIENSPIIPSTISSPSG
jgi:tripartite-type tricarboxylate transporter receptor subunit TctC